jgi:hypothetical protein
MPTKKRAAARDWRERLRRPPWRTVVPAVSLLIFLLAGYALWRPGQEVTDGRHDRERNGAWLQHGWLGDDGWFARYDKQDQKPRFRSDASVQELASLLRPPPHPGCFSSSVSDRRGWNRHARGPAADAAVFCGLCRQREFAFCPGSAACGSEISRPVMRNAIVASPPRYANCFWTIRSSQAFT